MYIPKFIDLSEFDEIAGIYQYEAGMTRENAEKFALKELIEKHRNIQKDKQSKLLGVPKKDDSHLDYISE